MDHVLIFEEGMFCSECYILQPIYQRCVKCGTIFELHCGRGHCLRYNPDRSPLSLDGLCRRCLSRLEQPGPSNPPPPTPRPPPPPPPPPPAAGSDGGHQNYPTGSGFQHQPHRHRHSEHTHHISRKERSQGRSFRSQTFDDKDEVFKETETLGYGTPGDFENGWWCCVNKKEEDEKKSLLELSPMKSVKSPTKKSKKSQPSDNESDDGESSDEGVIRKHKIRTTPEK